MRRAAALAAALSVAACGSRHDSISQLVRAEERAGVSNSLATCVARTAEDQLGDGIVRQLASHLEQLPPSLQASLTRIAAACATTTVTVTAPPGPKPTTTQPTTAQPTSTQPTSAQPTTTRAPTTQPPTTRP